MAQPPGTPNRPAWHPSSRWDPNYEPVHSRPNATGKLPPSPLDPALQALERDLGALAIAATSVVAGCGVFSSATAKVGLPDFEQEVESFDNKILPLYLSPALLPAQRQTLDRLDRSAKALLTIARASVHLADVSVYGQTIEERTWATTYLRPATDALLRLAMRVAEALNKHDPALAGECTGALRQADDAIADAAELLFRLPDDTAYRLCRAAVLSLQVMRDSFGLAAALLAFSCGPASGR